MKLVEEYLSRKGLAIPVETTTDNYFYCITRDSYRDYQTWTSFLYNYRNLLRLFGLEVECNRWTNNFNLMPRTNINPPLHKQQEICFNALPFLKQAWKMWEQSSIVFNEI